MKRVGILTFHRMSNIGAVLQTYATQECIENILGKSGEVRIIDFFPNNLVSRWGNGKLIRSCRFVRSMIKAFRGSRLYIKDWRFHLFRKKFYKLTKKRYDGDLEIFKNPPSEFDVFVSGSDQIYNLSLSGNSKAYYLAFSSNAKKISYASSFGRNEISKEELNVVRDELSKFSALSAREDVGVEIIKRETGRDAVLTLDPVFFLPEEKWRRIENPVSKLPPRYIFVYAMENSEALRVLVEKVRNYYKIPVIFSYWKNQKNLNWDRYDYWCGPREFLYYIDKASIVVTNSFHGLAFSLIYKKEFYCAAHSSRNSRLESLLKLTGALEKQSAGVVPNKLEELLINGKEAYDLLESHIVRSKRYLQENLE